MDFVVKEISLALKHFESFFLLEFTFYVNGTRKKKKKKR